jgi:hypothetical protein
MEREIRRARKQIDLLRGDGWTVILPTIHHQDDQGEKHVA